MDRIIQEDTFNRLVQYLLREEPVKLFQQLLCSPKVESGGVTFEDESEKEGVMTDGLFKGDTAGEKRNIGNLDGEGHWDG